MVKTGVWRGHGLHGRYPHPQRAGFVMRGAEPVPIASKIRRAGNRGKNLPHRVGCLVHGVPGVTVVRVWINRDEGAGNAELVCLSAEGNTSGRVASLQLRYSANGHDNIILIRLAEPIDGVDIRALLEKLGFGIGRISRGPTCRGDLQLEMAHAVVAGMGPATFHEERRRLEILAGKAW